jgi:hypothetical protein
MDEQYRTIIINKLKYYDDIEDYLKNKYIINNQFNYRQFYEDYKNQLTFKNYDEYIEYVDYREDYTIQDIINDFIIHLRYRVDIIPHN